MSITERLNAIKSQLPESVVLVAVSKTRTAEEIMKAYQTGHRVFGENKVQEMVQKWEILPKDIQWHMIGHLQRNKVKYMAEFVSLVHGVDSLSLLREINKQAKRHQRVIPCLLQIHIAQEDTKFGLEPKELWELLRSDEFKSLEHVKIMGLMGMATNTPDQGQIRKEFSELKTLFEEMAKELPERSILSMGMSSDHTIALEEGSTMLRIGSDIFGAREQY